MNILIAGDGEVGFNLAKMLSTTDDHNVVVVDPHKELLELLESNTDVLTIAGDSCSISVLEKANIRNTDLLISVLHDEEPNLLTCIIGKKLGAKRTIARVNSAELNRDRTRSFYNSLGIDKFVCPEQIASSEIVNLLQNTAATEVFKFGSGQLELLLIRIAENVKFSNKKIEDLLKEYPNIDLKVVAIHRSGETIIPSQDDIIQSRDLVYIITKPEFKETIYALNGKKEQSISNVMIMGAGRIGKKTAMRMEDEVKVKIIEKDLNRGNGAAAELSSSLVINGDATDINVLKEEGIETTDAFIAVTNNTEANILSCLYAKQEGVLSTIALVENIDYIDLAQSVGIDTIINKKLITASYIARFTFNAEVESSKVLSCVDGEVLEFVIRKDSKLISKTIDSISMPEGSSIGGIIRNKAGIVAHGKLSLEEGDRVVVFSEPYSIKKLSKLFR